MHASGCGEIHVGKCAEYGHYWAALMDIVQMPSWEMPPMTEGGPRLLPPTMQTELEVITAIQNLGNTVIANAASRSLSKYVSVCQSE